MTRNKKEGTKEEAIEEMHKGLEAASEGETDKAAEHLKSGAAGLRQSMQIDRATAERLSKEELQEGPFPVGRNRESPQR